MALSRRLLAPIVELRENESGIAVLMFAYSFLAMTAYNIIQPITRSRFISSPRRRQPPLRPARRRLHRRRDHAGLQPPGDGLLPRNGWCPRRRARWWCCSWGSGSRAGWGWTSVDVGVLPVRSNLRHSAHQPVLDAGQHPLRPASGEAAVRVHRRRRAASAASPAAASHPCSPRTVGNANLMLVSAGVLALCAVIVSRSSSRQRATRTSPAWSRPARKRVSAAARRSDAAPAAAQLQLIAAVIAMASIGAGHPRPAIEHGHRGVRRVRRAPTP